MNVEQAIRALRTCIEADDFKGYDPYDALNSPLLRALSRGSKWLRIAFIQAMKKSPINLRGALAVEKELNPKGLGLVLWGYAKLYAAERDPECLERIERILGLLDDLRSRRCSGNAWGYNFDWQSRAFFLPKFTPTVVNSSFIGHALLDTYRLTGSDRALRLALPIADFILKDLNRLEEGNAICLSYTPIDRYFVHNANLIGASLLIRLYRHDKRENLKDIAIKALHYSMSHQHDDGSWYYAEKKSSHWIDSFHTGFNLQAIRYFLDEGQAPEFRGAYDRGVKFYAERFFLEDGTPKYFHDRTFPIDIHAPAQALAFFGAPGAGHESLVRRVLGWTIRTMRDRHGFFYFQKHVRWTNRIPYMRWSQAWMFHALTTVHLRNSGRS